MKADPAALPVMTPELMKSRRTHSLQLAIAEIMHNRASVQSAATKYHIPRETLRRHYQRYLKAMGIQKKVEPQRGGQSGSTTPTPTSTTPSNSNNNNTKVSPATPTLPFPLQPPPGLTGFAAAVAAQAAAAAAAGGNNEDGSNGFSSLMEIGAAYGIWNPDIDGKKIRLEKAANNAAIAAADKEDKEKLVIDEDEDDDEEEPLSPGGPEEAPRTEAPMQIDRET